MKKLAVFMAAGLLMLTACTAKPQNEGQSESKPTMTIMTLNGNQERVSLEVPADPQRIAVLDMAVLDMLDSWGLGGRVVGMPKSSTVDYLKTYNENEAIVNLGTLKEVDMEALMASEPDLIFIGGRLSAQYDALSEIAPVVYLSTDAELGVVESVKQNAMTVASLFNMEDKAKEQLAGFDSRIETLRQAADVEGYDIIFLGFPNWWGDLPMPLYTFLEETDLSGKTIIPFVTHGGNGFSATVDTIASLQPQASVSDQGLSISRNDVSDAQGTVSEWLSGLEASL